MTGDALRERSQILLTRPLPTIATCGVAAPV
jgi:hypothetical protein